MNDCLLRLAPRLRADPRRVIAKLFVPGEEASDSQSRVYQIVERVRKLTEEQVSAGLDAVRVGFVSRHRDFEDILERHASLVSARLHETQQFSRQRRLLLGAYLTHEFSVEAAALCNPSMVEHPDQSGVPEGKTRFLMSVRAIGEGHLSSVEFRTGIVWPGGIVVDDPGRFLSTAARTTRDLEKTLIVNRLDDLGVDPATAGQVLSELPDVFTEEMLRRAMAQLHPHLLARQAVQKAVQWVGYVVSSQYDLAFPEGTPVGEQLIWPSGAAESHGMEDVRLVRFAGDDGAFLYHGTYTAYDSDHVAPHLLTTQDFRTYRIGPLAGPAARNKGMALFPRRVGGKYLALSRWDRENISLSASSDAVYWERGPILRSTIDPWEFIQVGNCGSPIETEAGWLVLTHGVGPMRTYSIGAILLDLDEPHRVLAETASPLLAPDAQERDGYVPNVVYSCGSLLSDDVLTIPYGISDAAIGFAQIGLATILERMRRNTE
ncbi:glycoside hydrolase family 130 protein [Allorhizocola rhizosphaerae]|uniref:glycoside hydrolase family 130 protein n=1 Tax=Allorhizocola rhizosphaerae TaxID=1872709 RepID=UPI000E3E5DB1|nr:glycoside hydrolase family 130 protein [Allorhizocola rhizosphaerae]